MLERLLHNRRTALAATGLTLVAAGVDAALGERVVLIPLLVVGPLLAAIRAPAAQVAAVALFALGLAVPLGEVDGIFLEAEHWADLIAITVVGTIAVAVARSRDRMTLSVLRSTDALAVEREARQRAELLARLTELLDAPLRPDVQLDRIAGLLVGDVADLVVIDLVDGEAVVRAWDAEVQERVAALRRRVPLHRAPAHPAVEVQRTGRPALLADMPLERLRSWSVDDAHLELSLELRYRSAVLVPLAVDDRVVGTLTVLRLGEAEPYTERDLATLTAYGARASAAVDKSILDSELRATQRRLEAILANLGESVVAVGPDGRVAFANDAAAEILGLDDPAEAVGRLPHELPFPFAGSDEHGNPLGVEDLPYVRALRGEPTEPLVAHASYADGSERWFAIRADPVKDDAGRVQLVVVVTEDVTAIKRVELRQRLLSEAGALMGSSLDVESTLEAAARAAVPELADWARLDLPDERGILREVAVAHRDAGKQELLREWRRSYPPDPADDRGPWEVLRTGRTLLWPRVEPDDVERYAQDARHAQLMRLIDTQSLVIVALVVGEQVIGTLELATTGDSGRRLGEHDVELAEELARRAAVAVENARVHQARSAIATTLQRSLLPPRLPIVAGLEAAARFRTATGTSDVGGDFYDMFRAREGWFLVMGDVTGKGSDAAAITSLARHTMRAVALYEDEPVRVLERLNDVLLATGDRRGLCTVVCVRVVPGPGGVDLEVACGGHPPPYLVGPGGVRTVGPPGTILGAFPDVRLRKEAVHLTRGEVLVLFTDGVPDTASTRGRFGLERLEALLADLGPDDPDVLATAIDEALTTFQDGPQRDDVALLVLRAA